MTVQKKNNIIFENKLLILLAILIVLLFIFLVHSDSAGQIKDEQALRLHTLKAMENTRSYRFDMYSNLSILNEEIQVIRAEGQVDLQNDNMVQSMIFSNRSMDVVIIKDWAYFRENQGAWQVRRLEDNEMPDDELSEQRSILFYTENANMSKVEGGWVLEIVPDRDDILEQMGTLGLEAPELKGFVTKYRIEEGTFHIRMIETYVDVEINFMGMQTVAKLENVIHLDNYNEKMEIKAPDILIQ